MTAHNKSLIRPIYGDMKLYYRHAEEENLFLLGSESNPHKTDWLNRQIDLFSKLGWKFLVLDMSEVSAMGRPHLLSGRWSNIERNALLNFVPPVIVRAPRFQDLLDTLDEINLIKSENPSAKHITVVYLGNIRALVPDEKDALYEVLLKLSTYHHGIWLAAERFQPFLLDKLDLFHTQIVFADEDEPDIEMQKWTKRYGIEQLDISQLDEEEAYCLFRGKSEGNGRLYVCNLSNKGDW